MLKNILKNEFWHDRESNQAIIRLFLGLLVTLQIGYGMQQNIYPQQFTQYYILAVAYNLFSVINLVSVHFYRHSRLRTFLTIPGDVIGVSYAMVLTGAGPFSPLFFLYPWMFVSYAVRYGSQHLYLVALSCIIAFVVIVSLNNAWVSRSLDAFVYLVFLVMLPFYLDVLLKRVLSEREVKERALNVRNEFLATMSHEIRTPMSGIVGMIALLQRTPLDEKQAEYVTALENTSDILHSLINDVLDLSKLEAGKTRLKLQPTRINDIIEQTLHVLAPRARAKNLSLTTQIGLIPARVMTDPNRLRQILLNLVSNAIKFTQSGGIRLKVSAEQVTAGWKLRFEVIDTGTGIEARHQSRVFDAFYQCNQADTLSQQGTGLGTTICKQLVDLMGGEIGLVSTHGQGSTFWFTIPVQEVAEAQSEKQAGETGVGHQDQRVLNILVAEDNPINARVIATFLEDEGHNVILVDNGEKALEKLQSTAYDIVFMDMRMPIMDGLEATKKWRQLSADNNDTPIIALTANASPTDRSQCLAAGMDDFLIKPVSPDELKKILQTFT